VGLIILFRKRSKKGRELRKKKKEFLETLIVGQSVLDGCSEASDGET
jgi:hypothetical protein